MMLTPTRSNVEIDNHNVNTKEYRDLDWDGARRRRYLSPFGQSRAHSARSSPNHLIVPHSHPGLPHRLPPIPYRPIAPSPTRRSGPRSRSRRVLPASPRAHSPPTAQLDLQKSPIPRPPKNPQSPSPRPQPAAPTLPLPRSATRNKDAHPRTHLSPSALFLSGPATILQMSLNGSKCPTSHSAPLTSPRPKPDAHHRVRPTPPGTPRSPP
jgi:hypothetical protein